MKKIHIYITGLCAAVVLAAGAVALVGPTSSALECSVLPDDICNAADKPASGGKAEDTGVWKLLILVINIMTAGVAILAVVGIVYGAVLYTSAGGNQEQVKKARTIFTNVAIGIIAFAAMWSLLNWLVPGGVFSAVSQVMIERVV
jgi:hypothetical protein